MLLHCYAMDKVYATGCDAETAEKWMKEHDGETLTLPVEVTGDTLPYFPKIAQGKNLLGVLLMRTRRDCRRLEVHC